MIVILCNIIYHFQLNISGIRAHWRALRTVGESLPKLESLIYKDMVNVTDKSLWYLFRVNGANIVSIDLRGCRRIKGYFLSLFGENLETVFIRLNHFVLISGFSYNSSFILEK